LQHLANLKNLQYLNLSGTAITKELVDAFKNLTALKNLYLFNCRISPSHYSDLKTFLPNAKIDTGGYKVPTFATDTTEVTAASE
jgi:Leucine-rich repeat (LRR) protein